jgi:hypothetical protein
VCVSCKQTTHMHQERLTSAPTGNRLSEPPSFPLAPCCWCPSCSAVLLQACARPAPVVPCGSGRRLAAVRGLTQGLTSTVFVGLNPYGSPCPDQEGWGTIHLVAGCVGLGCRV